MASTALIIDDEPDIRELVALTLTRAGIDTHCAANLGEARNLLESYEFDVCLTDMRLPDGNGVDFVKQIHAMHPELPVAVITAHGNMDAAVEAMKNGAFDFVSKPVDLTQLRKLVTHAISLSDSIGNTAANESRPAPASSPTLETLSQRDGDSQNASQGDGLIGGDKLIGQSQPMQELRRLISKVARTNAPIWITGESGTGKELIARLIHDNSPRSDGPFVAINCGAIPGELMESELFGHKKGSFTGAVIDKVGLFQQAEGGTLFLDEVAELPLHMQVKLLRAVQERQIRPVGANTEKAFDARILSASHADLADEVEAKRFRHDLYYRLNVISIRAPNLRDRGDDIALLATGILQHLSQSNGANNDIHLNQNAIARLMTYSFPGNVRELENILERAVAMNESSTITEMDLNLPGSEPLRSEHSFPDSANAERTRIVDALAETRWNRKAAANKLGLTYRQLRYRIQQLKIDETD